MRIAADQVHPAAGETATPDHLIEVAGRLFAEHGRDAVTGKQICLAAGVNAAAINYHFGGMEGLFSEVLAVAHARFVREVALLDAAPEATSWRERMTSLIRVAARAAFNHEAETWAVRLIGREFTVPSIEGAGTVDSLIEGRHQHLRWLVRDATGLPEGHPDIDLCCLAMAAPMQILMVADRALLKRIYPGIDLAPERLGIFVDRITRFVSGGLQAVAEVDEAKPSQGRKAP